MSYSCHCGSVTLHGDRVEDQRCTDEDGLTHARTRCETIAGVLSERAELIALLRKMDQQNIKDGRACPVCGATICVHNSDCRLAAALR